MRKLFSLLAAALFAVPCVAKGPATSPAKALLQRLAKIQKQGVMYGHQDDPFYGLTWEYEENRSDTKDLCGDYPAVMGFEIGGIEMNDEKNLDSVPFNLMRREIQNHHRRGGIITISWHPRNPLLGTTAWIADDLKAYSEAQEALGKVSQKCLAEKLIDPRSTVKSILPGGCKHEKFELWLHRVTDFLVSLTDDNGRPIPVIFRPWHENSGAWFWWGNTNCSIEEYHALWNMTQDFVAKRLPESIVWSFSPNLKGDWTEEEWLKWYPGDERTDLLGIDAYQYTPDNVFIYGVQADLKVVYGIAQKHNKLIAMTECGNKNSPDATWWTRVFAKAIEGYPVCYFLPWRNYPKEHFGVAPQTTTADDFKAWAKTPAVLLCKDIAKIK